MLKYLVLAFLLFCSGCTTISLIPGTYHVEYGGLYKIAVNETNRLLEGHWRDQQEALLQFGEIDYTLFLKRQNRISEILHDWRFGPPWWLRHWWHSFTPERGGAPIEKTLIQIGKNYKLIDTPFFSFSNSFDFRWKSVQAAIDFSSDQPITVGVGDVPTPKLGWKLRFSPEFSFSASSIWKNPTEAIRRIGLNIGGVHSVGGIQIVAIDVQFWYLPPEDAFFGLQLTLLQW